MEGEGRDLRPEVINWNWGRVSAVELRNREKPMMELFAVAMQCRSNDPSLAHFAASQLAAALARERDVSIAASRNHQ